MPDFNNLVRQRLAELHLAPAAESDLADEMAQHLEDRYRELRSAGFGDEDAYRQTVAELDDLHPLQSEQRMPDPEPVAAGEAKPGNVFDDTWRDIRYAFRTFRKTPVFVLFVVLTLALGIGANTTVFTVINTLILNPLPVRNISELVAVNAADTQTTAKSQSPFPISYPDLKDYRAGSRAFSELAGYTSPRMVSWLNAGTAQRMFTEVVTSNYFSTVGVAPAMGRFFFPNEDRDSSAAVAVLNYNTWQREFGGARDILGRTLRINHQELTIVGVAPPRFIGLNAIFGPDVWMPASMLERLFPTDMQNALADRDKAVFKVVGRLNPGATQAQAQAELSTLAAGLAREYPATHAGHTSAVRPLRSVLYGDSGGATGQIAIATAGLLIVVGIVLLIACSNVANLLLARAAVRQKEMAVRLAMGASRRRLVRQLLTESVLLGLMSGAMGVLIAYAGLEALFNTVPNWSNLVTPKLDVSVLLFALAVSLATGFVFGTIPALKASRADVSENLKEESRSVGKSRSKVTVQNALLVGQVAFSFVLLVTAALFVRSIGRAYQMDPGFQPAHLAMVMTHPGQAGYSVAQTKAFYTDVRDRVATLPRVESVSWASNLPLWANPVNGLQIEGRQARSATDTVRTIINAVDTGYFATAGVRLISGREFTTADRDNSAPVAIVNEKIARDYWPGGALGKRLQLPGEKQMRQVIGVARTVNYTVWGESPQACVYVPREQFFGDSMVLYVRSKGSPYEMRPVFEREIRSLAPGVLIMQTSGPDVLDAGLYGPRVCVGLLSIFGMLALTLASIGLYGIVAYSVNLRKREIGLRMALGATRANVMGLILREGLSLVGVGVVIGFALALMAGRALGRLLYGVSAADPASVFTAAAVLWLVALIACYLPARWAMRLDPVTALREA